MKPILLATAFALGGAAAMAVFAPPAFGATVRLYTPGGAPCAGVCTLEWAAAEFGVPVGDPVPMMIPAGATILKMSYGKNGQPYWMSDSAVFADDQPGQGYEVEIDGTTYWMVQIAECQNWALVLIPTVPIIWTAAATPYSPPPWSPPETPCLFCQPPPPACCEPPPPCCGPPPPNPPAVPLPGALWGLLTALAALGGRRIV